MITRKVSDVSISLIKANPGQPRKIFEGRGSSGA